MRPQYLTAGPVVCPAVQEIYPGSKKNHFRAIKEKTGIPYENMVGRRRAARPPDRLTA